MIAVVFALEFESASFRAKLPLAGVEVWDLGAMGLRAVATFEKRFKASANKPDLIISAGFAGALQPGIAVGDLVLGENYTSPRFAPLPPFGWLRGNLLTEPAIIEKSADKRRLGEATGALAGDLESSHLAEICNRLGVPMVAIRCISDALDDDMPVPANVLLNPETNRHEPLALFRHLITHPESITGFGKLLKNARTAQKSLAVGLLEILPQLTSRFN